jgi:hypothetical protein
VKCLPGTGREVGGVDEAIAFIVADSADAATANPVRYEVEVRFSNATRLRAAFPTRSEATGFLRSVSAG